MIKGMSYFKSNRDQIHHPHLKIFLKNFSLRENFTSFRKSLFNEARNLKTSLGFKFLWTLQGQFFLKK